jgi:hypothetical protein
MDLNPDFKDMLLALKDANVDFLVVGAYAVAAHGYPRATGDLDIWIRADEGTAPRVMRALAAFGAPIGELSAADFSVPSLVFQIGIPPGRIDILTTISGVDFSDAWENRMHIRLDEITFDIIGRADLIRNKKTSGRPKDIADVAALESSKNQ